MTSPVVITPERDHPREHAVLEALFALGLERCHVRKPHASVDELRSWIEQVPAQARSRLVLHQHHELVDEFGLGGRHWRETDAILPGGGRRFRSAPGSETTNGASKLSTYDKSSDPLGRELARASAGFTSRSCHDLEAVRGSLGCFDSVFLCPVFASVSKPGYGPSAEQPRGEGTPPTPGTAEVGSVVGSSKFSVRCSTFGEPHSGATMPTPRILADFLRNRTVGERSTIILALGGITAETAPRALALGFDGVAVLGAVWQASDPVAAYVRIRDVLAAAAQPARAPAPAPHPASGPDPECNLIGYTMPSLPRGGERVV